MAKADKMNRTNKPAAQKVIKQVKIQFSNGLYSAWSITGDRRISSHPTLGRCIKLSMRRGYAVVA